MAVTPAPLCHAGRASTLEHQLPPAAQVSSELSWPTVEDAGDVKKYGEAVSVEIEPEIVTTPVPVLMLVTVAVPVIPGPVTELYPPSRGRSPGWW